MIDKLLGIAKDLWLGHIVAHRVVPPRGGLESLIPIEHWLNALRGPEPISLELYADRGVVHFVVRSSDDSPVASTLKPVLPQASLDRLEASPLEKSPDGDWLLPNPGEQAVVVPMVLDGEPFLPLKTPSDHALAQGELDPLAPVLGFLTDETKPPNKTASRLETGPESPDSEVELRQ